MDVSNGRVPETKVKAKPQSSNGSSVVDGATDKAKTEGTSQKHEDTNTSVRDSHFKEQLTFVLSVCSVIVVAYGVLSEPWILPYFYSIVTPMLMFYRVFEFARLKWQLFMLGFCYFGNVICFVTIWFFPSQPEAITVLFSMCTAILPWALVMFQNALVFHDISEMTSAYIHVLPFYIAFSMRWHNEALSEHWYTEFATIGDGDWWYMFTWLFAAPLLWFIVHTGVYSVIVHCIIVPDEEYLDAFRWMASEHGAPVNKLVDCMGPRHHLKVFNILMVAYAILVTALVPVFYNYYVAHCGFVIFVTVVSIWNAGSYYMKLLPTEGKAN